MERFLRLKSYNVFFLLVISTLNLNAQYSEEFVKYSDVYPEANRVRLQQNIEIRIEENDGKISIKQNILEEDLFLNESATYNSKNRLSFSSFFELENIEASSFNYNNGKYSEIEVTNFIEKDELDDSFYDDSKTLNFIYPNLKKGSKTKLTYTQIVKNPRFLSTFYLADYFPIINNKIKIIVDNNIGLDFKKFYTDKVDLTYSTKKRRKTTEHLWEIRNTKDYDFENDAPSFKNFLPHIVPLITTVELEDKTISILGDVKDLYGWYYSLVKDINKDDSSPELIALVKELTKDKKTDLEKVKAIYYWTQKNIKYIAFEYALGGFIPRESNDVFRKKYGDCKDNSSILYKMLEIAGLDGNLTWIGTRSIPYTYEQVPTPVVDNHMILTYNFEGKNYFLDATGRYIKMGLPTSFIQGKEALVSYKNDFKIVNVPIIEAKENIISDDTKLQLINGQLIGESTTTLRGYPKIDIYNKLENLNTNAKTKEFYNLNLKKGNNKFLITDYKEINKYDYDEAFSITYDFKIENYAKKLGDEIYINLNLNQYASDYKVKKNRKRPLEYDYKRFYQAKTTLEIPKGYAVDYIPESKTFKNDLLVCEINYEIINNTVVYQQKFTQDYLVLKLEDQKTVNDLIKKIEKFYKEIIVLKKK
ncbi:DUF3857 domain-containing protein [Polaribacter sp. MED152]|uniref:DUF3857 domain-containing protein n=1 Tax=Polaribacter sp. MED152 TaxID=313598 RepID=UPI000068C556|nr:DUF3857 domain-containing protein [Polaribacter sp. MED152]EAQ43110.1 hypothetical protein MED152_10310 [Polaribacter sp. MED152]